MINNDCWRNIMLIVYFLTFLFVGIWNGGLPSKLSGYESEIQVIFKLFVSSEVG